MGKSRVLRHYASKFGATRKPNGVLQREVVLVEAPEDGELAHMRGAIARACLPGLQVNAYYSTEEVLEILMATGVRQLLLDEMGNVLNGSRSSQLRVLALLKRITNMGITAGIATTENLRFVLSADDQLKSRFHITVLRPWGETEELRAFLDAVEMQLPLPSPSHLASPDVVRCLLSRDCHSTSDILDPIRDACRMAFYDNAPCISIPTLKQAIEAFFPPDGGMEPEE
ncbi:hypothetical protein RT95_06710 [Xanthomonas campestris]|nr:hypothetical protein RT95_06710 [Xanthomonas campestris]